MQMGKAIVAKVIATAGSEEKLAKCRELGADLAINYKTQDVAAEVQRFAPDGVNVYWETTREPAYFERAVGMLAQRGRMILMAGCDAKPPFPVGPFYVKGCSLFGFAMFQATPEELRACAEQINGWVAAGKIKPNIDRIMPLAETAARHRLQEESTVGKSVHYLAKLCCS